MPEAVLRTHRVGLVQNTTHHVPNSVSKRRTCARPPLCRTRLEHQAHGYVSILDRRKIIEARHLTVLLVRGYNRQGVKWLQVASSGFKCSCTCQNCSVCASFGHVASGLQCVQNAQLCLSVSCMHSTCDRPRVRQFLYASPGSWRAMHETQAWSTASAHQPGRAGDI